MNYKNNDSVRLCLQSSSTKKTEMSIITAIVSVIHHTVLNCHAGNFIKLIGDFLKMFIIILFNRKQILYV